MAEMMELGKVAPILKQLGIDEPRALALQAIQKSEPKYAGKFIGEIAVDTKMITQDHLDAGLNAQALDKIRAATKDIAAIQEGKTLDAPRWLQANWGGNGVSQPDRVSASSGASGVANMLQNMTMVLKDHPEAAKDPKIAAALGAAQGLAAQLVPRSDGKTTPLADPQGAIKAVGDGLKHAVEATATQPKDRNGQEVSIDAYIAARSQEASQGIAQVKAREAAIGGISGGQSVESPAGATPFRDEPSSSKANRR